MTKPTYDSDVIAWANEQARLLRAGQWADLDIEHLADEIEDVGKGEQHEFENRMAVLLAHLLNWQCQPERRGASWRRTIQDQREGIARRLRKTPSLKADLHDPEWWAEVWADARKAAEKETGIEYANFPETCPWVLDEVMDRAFWPDAANQKGDER